MEWGRAELSGEASKSVSKDFEFDLGVIDATEDKEKLYEKILDNYIDKNGVKKELESGTIVVMSALAEKKINALLMSFRKLEWTVGLVGRYDDEMEVYYVSDVVVCEQEVSGVSVELTAEGNKELAKVRNVIGWCHSHNDMNSFHSSTDMQTTSTFGLGMTVNNRKEYDVKIRKDLSIGLSVIVQGLVLRESEVLNDVKDWLDESMKKIKERTYSGWQGKSWNRDKDYESSEAETEELCGYCYQQLPKLNSRRSVCPVCREEFHKKCMRAMTEAGQICGECYMEEGSAGGSIVYTNGLSGEVNPEDYGFTYRS